MSFEAIQVDWSKSGAYWLDLLASVPRDELRACVPLPAHGATLTDDAAMFLACSVALNGAGSVAPNPLVGAVLLAADGGFISAGAHLKIGASHAEVNAIESAPGQSNLEGASLFVTLEPCAHEGKTPSCAKMIAGTQIKRVVYGLVDPNHKVAGQGLEILRAAGKKVETLPAWQNYCEWLARVFLHNQRHSEIFTAMKVASTPSGVIAGDGTSRLWVTGERARQMGHFLRLEYDAIMVGIQTVLLDDPSLDLRHPVISGRSPLRIVLDPRAELFHETRELKLLTTNPEGTLVILPAGTDDRPFSKKYGVKTLCLQVDSNGQFKWPEIKQSLWTLGLSSLLIEGGAGLYKSAIRESAVDAIHWFVGPEKGLTGVTWAVLPELRDRYKKGGGAPLLDDRLLEVLL